MNTEDTHLEVFKRTIQENNLLVPSEGYINYCSLELERDKQII